MNETCGCCEGIEPLTPVATTSRPGLNALGYRVGTHADFLATMKARLSAYPALARLTTRDPGDFAVALLDAWATVADVLTFYQERIANEGYLRTATERRSILELARLVGFASRPGVAASTYLAFALEDGYDLEIAAGTRAQSLPAAGELPQSFETAEKLEAQAAWNDLEPRMTRPQHIHRGNADVVDTLYFEGLTTNLGPNTPVLLVFGDNEGQQVIRRVESVELQAAENRTRVILQNGSAAAATAFVSTIRQAVEQYLDPGEFGGAPSGQMARRVQHIVDKLRATAEHEEPYERLLDMVGKELPSLQREHASAVEGQRRSRLERPYSRLEPRLRRLVATLERAVSMHPTRSAEMPPGDPVALDAHKPSLTGNGTSASTSLAGLLVAPLSEPPAPQPANALQLRRSRDQAFAPGTDAVPRMLLALNPALRPMLYTALGNATVTPSVPVKVYALGITASLFGHNAPKRPLRFDPATGNITQTGEWPFKEEPSVVNLDTSYEQILPDSWIVVETANTPRTNEGILITKAKKPNANVSRGEYGLTGNTTRIELAQAWITKTPQNPSDDDFQAIRRTTVYAQSEELTLSEEPYAKYVCGDRIELGDLYDGLDAGRLLVVEGERTDIKDAAGEIVRGVMASELVMVADVVQGVEQISVNSDGVTALPGDKIHSTLMLAGEGLNYSYERGTVTIYGNVVRATHGETRTEVLGSGDSSEALQSFVLRQSPLTYVPATTPTGTESTLEVYADEVRWREAETLASLGPTDRCYVTITDEQDNVTVSFGDGERGARLPTGAENVEAVYRTGIGEAGNIPAGQISQLATRPLGLQGVTNPLDATGGANRDTDDQVRRNTPLAVMALDRLVSVQDYEDFARTFAGIGKASAVRFTDRQRRLVHLTIAGTDDIPIAEYSDLYQNLVQALQRFGDPHQPFRVEVRELILLIISASVRVLPDRRWESVEPEIRAAMLDTFGFEQRELGQDALLSEVISTIQGVPGVAYVDVGIFGGIPGEATEAPSGERRPLLPDQIADELEKLIQSENQPLQRVPVRLAGPDKGLIRPAQLAFLSPEVPETLKLEEITA